MPKRIGIITPGGDASGINACIRAVVREAVWSGLKVFGIYRGYQGLLEGDIRELGARSVGNIIQDGGTILRSARCEAIKTEDGIRKAAEQLKRRGIDCLMVVGGDGSLQAGLRLSKRGVPVMGIPASIDNDVYGTEETIGFDTAVDVAVEAIDKIRDTATSFDRIFLVQVMGRKRGFLALEVGLASGAEYIMIPEIKEDLRRMCSELHKAKEKGKTSGIVVFAEGAGDIFKTASVIERITRLQTRASILGYIQRGGAPSGRSRTLATRFGVHATHLVKAGILNKMIVLEKNKVTHIPLKSAMREKKIDIALYDLTSHLSI